MQRSKIHVYPNHDWPPEVGLGWGIARVHVSSDQNDDVWPVYPALLSIMVQDAIPFEPVVRAPQTI